MKSNVKHSFRDSWLANALVYYQVMSPALLDELAIRHADEKYIYSILTKNNYLNEKEIENFVKIALQVAPVNLDKVDAERNVLDVIPEEICSRYNLLPLQMNDSHVAVAFSDPFNLDAENEIEYLTRKYVKKFFVPMSAIKQKINEYYSPEKLISALVSNKGKQLNIKFEGDSSISNDAPVVRLFNQIINDALSKKVSDIHIEPKEKSILVRFRIDGVLHNDLEVPRSIHAALISRIKIVSSLNIAETRKPQDGKAKVLIDEKDIDLRVSMLPTSYGEKVVIRLLDKRNANISFEAMGIQGDNFAKLDQCFQYKQGMVLVTGPTGSGKSTTLYAAINRIRSTTNNILTIEDPIEYRFDGINQVQVNEKAGVTFASALRSFLRQDPDVILVGEVRDNETAEISIQASLTGHLVLSTLHTNDTFTTITRLKDMGIDRFKITEALQAIIAQRLVRTLCPHCKTEVASDNIDEKLYKMLTTISDRPKVYEPKGCPKCGYMGYKGRIGVYEILILDNTLKDMIANEVSINVVRKTARTNGFKNLFEDALHLVATGVTDYNEIVRVVNPTFGVVKKNVVKEIPKLMTRVDEPDQLKIEISEDVTDKKASTPIVNKMEKPVVDTLKKRAKILVTDDAPQNRLLVTRILQKKTNWETLEAEDGEKALEMIKKDKPDLLILDIMMPNMDGYELLQELKSTPNLSDIPVLIFTALKTPTSEQKVYELGADGFIVKPIEPKRLVEQIRKTLERKYFITSDNSNNVLASSEPELQLV